MSEPIDHIYLSPHLDDAVCSCGGLIQAQSQRGERVLVVTFFTEGAVDEQVLPPYLRAMHLLWGFGLNDDPYVARREEDIAALELLGAGHLHVGMQGALYRQGTGDRYLYTGLRFFGNPVSEDIRLLVRLRRALFTLREQHPNARFYAPLSVGGHVDHRLVHRAARYLPGELAFYEDVPYVLLNKIAPFSMRFVKLLTRLGIGQGSGGMGEKSLRFRWKLQSKSGLFGGPQLTLMTNRPPRPNHWQSVLHPIDLSLKVDAMNQYVSQIPLLFGPNGAAWRALESYSTAINEDKATPVERQWLFSPRTKASALEP